MKMFLSVAKLKISASEDAPRIIRREELPEDYEPYWHATTALDQVRQQGLRSRTERQTEQQALGGGTSKYVSLTNDREVAENISDWLKDLIAVSSVIRDEGLMSACQKAEELVFKIAQESGVEDKWPIVLKKARDFMVSNFLAIKEEVNGMTPYELVANGYSRSSASDFGEKWGLPVLGFFFVKLSDLPDDCLPLGISKNAADEPMTNNVIYPMKYKIEDVYDDPRRRPVKYYDWLRTFLESEGGAMSPMGWELHPKNFWDIDPNQVGVVDMLTQGKPDRDTGALGEWAGLPEKTRVIVD